MKGKLYGKNKGLDAGKRLYPKFRVNHKCALSEICQLRVHFSEFGAYSY